MPNDPSTLKLLSALRGVFGRVGGVKLAAVSGATFLALAAAVGAGAAPSPFAPVSEVLGIGGERGAAVSEAVHDAKAAVLENNATNEEGEADKKIGPAVSEAACEAAHDPSLHPHAEDAGEDEGEGEEVVEDEGGKDCTHPSNVVADEGEGSEEEGELALLEEGEEEEALNHGAAVSQAVHDAKASLEEGEKVGPAVSEAACTAAHDRTTLPAGAQNAPGQVDRPEKDCTHPSNAGDEEGEEGNEESLETSEVESSGGPNGRGRDSAPGQQKKQAD